MAFHAVRCTAMQAQAPGRLHADLAELLKITRSAERELFAMLTSEQREAPGTIGEWSAKDVLAHLAAWRAIEARRLQATARGEPYPAEDPSVHERIDDSNATLYAQRAAWSWDQVDAAADASVQELLAAIHLSSHDVLCECEDTVTGIGANGANHGMAHLSDVARLAEDAGGQERYGQFARELETVLGRRHLRPLDTGVMLYNIACHRAVTGDSEEARRLLRLAFGFRPQLRESAKGDPDLVSLPDAAAL
jgi:hypothetical protein